MMSDGWPDTGDDMTEIDTDGFGTWEPFETFESVSMVYQYDDTSCWAAGIAMLVGQDLDTVLGEWRDVAMTWERIEPIAHSWGVQEVYPACGLPSYWVGELQRHGPMWIVIKQGSGTVSHAVVFYGIQSDGTAGGTYCYYNDPINGPSCLVYEEFERVFEVGAVARANLFAMR
jgi:hypothetical protein